MDLPEEVKNWLVGCEHAAPIGDNAGLYTFPGTTKDRPYTEAVLKKIYIGGDLDLEMFKKLRENGRDEYSVMKKLEEYPHMVKPYKEYVHRDNEHKISNGYILMEYCGVNLENYLTDEKTKLTLADRVKLSYEVAQAVCEIQEARIIHNDLKTQNLAINKNGLVKLIDFGSSFKGISTTTYKSKPQEGVVRGFTVGYAAPEAVCGQKKVFEDLIDVYSFGRIQYQIMFKKTSGEMRTQFLAQTTKIGELYKFKAGAHDAFLEEVKRGPIPGYETNDFTDKLLSLMVECMQSDQVNEAGKRRIAITEVRDRLKEIMKLPVPKAVPDVKPLAAPVPVVPLRDKLLFVNPTAKTLCVVHFNGATEVLPLSNLPADCGLSTTTTMNNRVFALGDSKIYEVVVNEEGKQPEIRPAKEPLKFQHLSAALVSDDHCLYILGGKTHDDTYLRACEAYDFLAEKVLPFTDLSEAKAEMAACIFNSRYIYVFGGELDLDICVATPKSISHNFSQRIEVIDKSHPEAWKTIEVAKDSGWGGCGLSAAVQVKDNIVILGGILNIGGDYEWEVNCTTYTPATNKFSPKVVLDDSGRVESFFNNGYMLPSGKILCCSNTEHEGRCQNLCTFDPMKSQADFSFVSVKQ